MFPWIEITYRKVLGSPESFLSEQVYKKVSSFLTCKIIKHLPFRYFFQISVKFGYFFINNPNSLWFFTSISNCDLKYIQGFVCFYCQKIIIFQIIPCASKYPERMVSENACRFKFIWCRSRYLVIRRLFNRHF